ncbi:MAG TPA: MBL fold metallo-hydrolase [Prolixibacteraceae bacterium]|nr:MBL fold metallo-hydrolase [Prolixibacteraceae bacterium]
MYITISIMALVSIATLLTLNLTRFGKAPSGERLKRIQQSINYKDGKFQNQSFTPDLAEDASYFSVMKDAFFKRSKRNRPKDVLPSEKNNLKELDPEKNVLVWFGHSSYFMQIDGKKIVVDPVFSGSASPFSFMVRSFKGTDVYTPEDMPDIDYLFITHDHWDHLDYQTVLKLKPKVGKVITGLGTGAHLQQWGFDPDKIIEKDWNEQAILDSGFITSYVPGRHFSGRGFKRNQAMWGAFVLQTPSKKLFIGGDSGYDTHFAKIGEEYGPFDLALLECGQYNNYWKYIHMMPEETVQAAIDLKAKTMMPVHWAKFALAYHAWDEPIERLTKEAQRLAVPIIHPMIGELVDLNKFESTAAWWTGMK